MASVGDVGGVAGVGGCGGDGPVSMYVVRCIMASWHGAWCMVHGAWCMVHGQKSSTRVRTPALVNAAYN